MNNPLLDNIEDIDRIFLVKTLHSGQTKPYGPSIYEYEVTYTGKNISTKESSGGVLVCGGNLNKKMVLRYISVFCHEFKMPEEAHWYDPVLKKCEKIRETSWGNTWSVLIEKVYDD